MKAHECVPPTYYTVRLQPRGLDRGSIAEAGAVASILELFLRFLISLARLALFAVPIILPDHGVVLFAVNVKTRIVEKSF